jgi:hypothetical protein
MPTFAATLLICAVCGAALTSHEQEANLRLTSVLIAMRWQHPIRRLCLRCLTHGPQEDPEHDCEDDEPRFPGRPA